MNTKREIPAIEISTEVAARSQTVYRFFTDPGRFSEWLGAEVSFTPEIGGALRIDFALHGTIVAGEVLELVPDRRVVFTWGVEAGPQAGSMPAGSTTVEVTLEPAGEHTLVTLRHQGLPNESERKDHEGGWREYLERLSRVVTEGGTPNRRSR